MPLFSCDVVRFVIVCTVFIFKGRIMNRFTKDMATIDDMLPLLMFDLIQVCNHNEFQNLCAK